MPASGSFHASHSIFLVEFALLLLRKVVVVLVARTMDKRLALIIQGRRTIEFIMIGLASLVASFFVTGYLRGILGVTCMVCALVCSQRATRNGWKTGRRMNHS